MESLVNSIRVLSNSIGRPVRLMEVCGTHTVAIFRHGIRNVIPGEISLLSGPGCPVCVTPVDDVDTAVAAARTEGVVMTTFGDMMRVPGTKESLFDAKACGGDVRIVYSPLDALALAEKEPGRKVVFFATGFETTSPLVAGTVLEAERRGIENFFIYPVHKTVPPALRALLDAGETNIDGFILPGHVSTIIGTAPYDFIPAVYGRPGVVTGFDAPDILSGIAMLLSQIASGEACIDIQYASAVRREGNPKALEVLDRCFEPGDAYWRGIGVIAGSGLELRRGLRHRDMRSVLEVVKPEPREPKGCACGEVLKGLKTPPDCRLFGKLCTPERPVGACMVSTEGSCAAYYRYGAIGYNAEGGGL